MLDPALRLRHLVCFAEVARRQSVVRAAASLHVTQPAVSKTIRELEAILGVALFDRSRRNVQLTRFGEILLRHVDAGLLSLRQGVDLVSEATSPEAVPVRVGALPTVSARLLPGAVRRFMAHRSGALPRIVTGPNAFLMAQLRQGDLDLVIGRMAEPSEMTGFAFEHLYSEEIRFVVRPGHPLLAAPVFESGAIAGYEMLMPPPGSVISPVVDRLLLAAGWPRPRGVIETVSLAFGRAYVRASDAIWAISEGVVLQDVAEGVLASLPVDTSQTLGSVGITLRAQSAASPAVELLLRELRSAAAAI